MDSALPVVKIQLKNTNSMIFISLSFCFHATGALLALTGFSSRSERASERRGRPRGLGLG